MRHLVAALLLVVTPAPAFAARAGVSFRSGSLADALAAAKAQKKKLFVDVFATWCGPCHRLDAQVFAKAEVAKALESQWIALEVDGEKGEGPELAKRYHVVGYPTVLFLDAEGNEIDRVFGELPAEEFVATAQAFAKGEKTLAADTEAYFAKHLFDAGFAADLATRWAVKGDLDRAQLFVNEVRRIAGAYGNVAHPPRYSEPEPKSDPQLVAKRAAAAETLENETLANLRQTELDVVNFGILRAKSYQLARARLVAFVNDYADTPQGQQANLLLATAYHGLNDDASAKAALDAYLADVRDAHGYNAYAWWCFKQHAFLDDGISAAKKGLELDPKDDGLWDTLAELQYATGHPAEAVASENKALSLGSGEAGYYKSQIEKFSK